MTGLQYAGSRGAGDGGPSAAHVYPGWPEAGGSLTMPLIVSGGGSGNADRGAYANALRLPGSVEGNGTTSASVAAATASGAESEDVRASLTLLHARQRAGQRAIMEGTGGQQHDASSAGGNVFYGGPSIDLEGNSLGQESAENGTTDGDTLLLDHSSGSRPRSSMVVQSYPEVESSSPHGGNRSTSGGRRPSTLGLSSHSHSHLYSHLLSY